MMFRRSVAQPISVPLHDEAPASGWHHVGTSAAGARAAGSAALCPHVGQVATAERAEGLAETGRQPVAETNRCCVGDERRGERERGREGLHVQVKYILIICSQKLSFKQGCTPWSPVTPTYKCFQ